MPQPNVQLLKPAGTHWLCPGHYAEYYQKSAGITGLPDRHDTTGELPRFVWIVERFKEMLLTSPRYERAREYVERNMRGATTFAEIFVAEEIANRVYQLLGLPVCCTIPPDEWLCLMVSYSLRLKTSAFLEEPR